MVKKLLLVLMLCLCSLTVFALDSSNKIYLPFDGNSYDLGVDTGVAAWDFKNNQNAVELWGNAATTVNGAILSSDGYIFNGSVNYINTTITSLTNDWSVIFTAKKNGMNYYGIVSTLNGGPTQYLWMSDANLIYDGNATIGSFNCALNSTYQLSYTNYAVIKNSTAITYYYNGVQKCSVLLSSYPQELNAYAFNQIGGNYGVGYNFNGTIKNFAVYDRALTAAEVLALNNSDRPPIKTQYYNVNGLVWSNSFKFYGNDSVSALKNDINTSQTAIKVGATATSTGMSFDGSGDYINAEVPVVLRNNTSNVTYSVTFIQRNTAKDYFIFTKNNNTDSYDYGLYTYPVGVLGAGNYACQVMNTSGGGHAPSSFLVQNNTQYTITCIIDATNKKIYQYINGEYYAESGIVGNILNNYSNYTIGAWDGARAVGTGGFNGTISDVRIYNRSLSSDEVMALFRGGNFTSDRGNQANKSMYFGGSEVILFFNRGVTNFYQTKPSSYSIWSKRNDPVYVILYSQHRGSVWQRTTITDYSLNFNNGTGNTITKNNTLVGDYYKWGNTIANLNSSTSELYHNGILHSKSTGLTTGYLYNTNDTDIIGSSVQNINGLIDKDLGYKGQMDEFNVFNKTLSQNEVSKIYAVNTIPTLTLINPTNTTYNSNLGGIFVNYSAVASSYSTGVNVTGYTVSPYSGLVWENVFDKYGVDSDNSLKNTVNTTQTATEQYTIFNNSGVTGIDSNTQIIVTNVYNSSNLSEYTYYSELRTSNQSVQSLYNFYPSIAPDTGNRIIIVNGELKFDHYNISIGSDFSCLSTGIAIQNFTDYNIATVINGTHVSFFVNGVYKYSCTRTSYKLSVNTSRALILSLFSTYVPTHYLKKYSEYNRALSYDEILILNNSRGTNSNISVASLPDASYKVDVYAKSNEGMGTVTTLNYTIDTYVPTIQVNANNPSILNTSWYYSTRNTPFNFTIADANLFGYNLSCVQISTGLQEYSVQELGLTVTSKNITASNRFSNPGRKRCTIVVEDDHTAERYVTESVIKEPILGIIGRPVIELGTSDEKVEFVWDSRNDQSAELSLVESYDRVSPVIDVEPSKGEYTDLYWTVKFSGDIYDRSAISGIPGHVVLWSGTGKSQWYDAVDNYKDSIIDYEVASGEVRYHAMVPNSEFTGRYKTESLGGLNSYNISFEFDVINATNVTTHAYKTMNNGTIPFNVTVTSYSYGTETYTSPGTTTLVTVPTLETATVKINSTQAMNSVTENIIGGSPTLVNASLYGAILTLNVVDSIYGDPIPNALISITDGGSFSQVVNASTGTNIFYLQDGVYYLNASKNGFTASGIYSIDINLSDQITESIVLDKSYNVTILREQTGLPFNRTYLGYNASDDLVPYNSTITTMIKCPTKVIEHTYTNMSEIINNIDCPFTSWQTFISYPEVTLDGSVYSYFREVIPTISDTHVYLYMLESGTPGFRHDDPIKKTVNLRDISGDYIGGYLQVIKSINEENKEIIYMPYDVGNQAILYLQKDKVYTPCIISDEGVSTCLADLYATADGEASLTVPDIPLYNVDPQPVSKIGFEMVPYRDAGYARAYFRGRTTDGTTFYNMNLSVYEYANNTKGALAFEYINTPGISNVIVQVFPLSESKTYIYSVSYKHTSDQSQTYYKNDQLLWNAKRDADPGVEGDSNAKVSVWFNDKFSTDLKIVFGLLVPLFILLIISMANVEIGVFAACALFILFNQWGFYETTWIAQVGWINWIVAVFMILNVISFYRKLRRTT